MEKNIRRLILLLSLVLVAVPMVLFPHRLGISFSGGSALFLLYEMIFYGVVLYAFRRDARLSTLMVGAALTLVYRLVLGAAFGVTIIIMYSLDSSIAFSLGMAKYMPGIILQVLAAPFVLRPVYLGMAASLSPVSEPHYRRGARREVIGEASAVTTPSLRENLISPAAPAGRSETASPNTPAGSDDNQFDRAMAYLGESGAVRMALLVDLEGLPLARFNRSPEEPEDWAPYALVSLERNCNFAAWNGQQELPERVDVGFRSQRLLIRRIDRLILMLVTEPNVDETIHIRIAQAADMIRKYMNERYSPAIFARVEGRYVSHS